MGQNIEPFTPKSGGEGFRADDGTRLRIKPDGTARVDAPGRGPKGQETIHFND